ncbi:hypothetical protein ACPC5U_13040 [Acinetobacter haemolyticus]|uniref:hypothetical protein n=1 Tax=Acinetobacter haemolyticus TaxID=29430 RepID=UPI003C223237
MRKSILLGLMLALPLVTHAKVKYEPECKVSGFDNATTCFIKPFGAWVENKKTILSFVSFGGTWTSVSPDNIGLGIFYGDALVNIESVSFNIDGKISTFKTELMSNKVSTQGRLSNTTALTIIPIEYLGEIINATEVKYRVTTISDGYREGTLNGSKGESPAFQALKGIYNSAKKGSS